MNTNRRSLLKKSMALASFASAQGVLGTGAALAQNVNEPVVQRDFAPQANAAWREFEVSTTVQIKSVQGATRVWLPIPCIESEWQNTLSSDFVSNGESKVIKSGPEGVAMLMSVFSSAQTNPQVQLISRVRTKNRKAGLDQTAHDPHWKAEANDTLAYYKRSTRWLPTDGIVKSTALSITKTAQNDLQKVRLIYDWVVSNTYREVKVRGCGEGDIKGMLETGNLGGKCADINAVFVGLCRAVGIAARDVYGLRLVPSAFGYKELSGNPSSLKGAQHCRAEVYLQGMGWVAMDPADVAKAMRQESPVWIKDVHHPLIKPLYTGLFGAWEGNWMGWNTAHDVKLEGSSVAEPLPFLMYPIAENDNGRFDSYEPDLFSYQITAKEIKTSI